MLSTTRQGQFINRARARLDNLHRWPYRLTTTTSIASIADMGQVDTVVNTTRSYLLEEWTLEEIQDAFGTLTTTGSPTYWYRTSTGVATFPVTTDTVTVRYWKRTPDLSQSTSPASPDDYHMLIVDMADQLAKRDAGNYEAAGALQSDIDRQVGEMVDDLLPQSEPMLMRMTDASVDG